MFNSDRSPSLANHPRYAGDQTESTCSLRERTMRFIRSRGMGQLERLHQLGPEPIASWPAVVSWGPNRIDVFCSGNGQCALYEVVDGTAWSNYTQLGPQPIGSWPAVVSWGPNRIDVFVKGTDNALYTKSWNGSAWSDYTQLRAATYRVSANRRILGTKPHRCVCSGTDKALWTKSWNGTAWSDYIQLGPQPIAGPPSAICWGPNHIAVFVAALQMASTSSEPTDSQLASR